MHDMYRTRVGAGRLVVVTSSSSFYSFYVTLGNALVNTRVLFHGDFLSCQEKKDVKMYSYLPCVLCCDYEKKKKEISGFIPTMNVQCTYVCTYVRVHIRALANVR